MPQGEINFWVILFWFLGLQGLILSYILFFKKRGIVKGSRVLGVLVFLFSLILLAYGSMQGSLFGIYPHFLLIAFPFYFLRPPLYYLYSLVLTRKAFRFKKIYLLHLIPFLLYVIYMLFIFKDMPDAIRLTFMVSPEKTDSPGFLLLFFRFAISIQEIIYVFLGIRVIKRYQMQYEDEHSAAKDTRIPPLLWLRRLFILLFLQGVVVLGVTIYMLVTGTVSFPITHFAVLANSFIMYMIAYLALFRQWKIYPLDGPAG